MNEQLDDYTHDKQNGPYSDHQVSMNERLRQIGQRPNIAELEAAIRGQVTIDLAQHRADAINAVLRAKGSTTHFTHEEADKVWHIFAILEGVEPSEVSG